MTARRTQSERLAVIEDAVTRMADALEAHRREAAASDERIVKMLMGVIGSESDDGKGGQGIRGEVARLKARVGMIERIGYAAAGVLSVVSLFAEDIINGLKGWLHLQ